MEFLMKDKFANRRYQKDKLRDIERWNMEDNRKNIQKEMPTDLPVVRQGTLSERRRPRRKARARAREAAAQNTMKVSLVVQKEEEEELELDDDVALMSSIYPKNSRLSRNEMNYVKGMSGEKQYLLLDNKPHMAQDGHWTQKSAVRHYNKRMSLYTARNYWKEEL